MTAQIKRTKFNYFIVIGQNQAIKIKKLGTHTHRVSITCVYICSKIISCQNLVKLTQDKSTLLLAQLNNKVLHL